MAQPVQLLTGYIVGYVEYMSFNINGQTYYVMANGMQFGVSGATTSNTYRIPYGANIVKNEIQAATSLAQMQAVFSKYGLNDLYNKLYAGFHY